VSFFFCQTVYIKKDRATRGASACAARAIPPFIIRQSSFVIPLKHHRYIPFFDVAGNQRADVIDIDAQFFKVFTDAVAI